MFYDSDALDSTAADSKQQWTLKATKLLLELYKERKENFRDPKVKKRNLWRQIVHEMEKNGYTNLTEDTLDRKLRNLKKTFRTIKDNNRKSSTGRGRITWEYYDIFEEIFIDDRTINFGPTISSLDPTQRVSSAASTVVFPTSTSSASSSTQLIPSPVSTRTLTLPSPVRISSPASTRYVCHTPLTRTSMSPVLMTNTFFRSFDSTFADDSCFEENISNCSFSSYSSSSAAAEQSCSESESAIASFPQSDINKSLTQRKRKKVTSRETYDLRKQLLSIENERVEYIHIHQVSIQDI